MRIRDFLSVISLVAAGARGAITGEKTCNEYICVTGLHDSDARTDTYTLSAPEGKGIPMNDFGWMALGFGQGMAKSPMVIGWPNKDGSFTLSQRQSPGHAAPRVATKAPRIATLSTARSFSNSQTTSFTFTLPSYPNTTASTDLIWAYSAKNPKSSAGDAAISQHLASGGMTMSLLAPYKNDPPTASGSNATSSTGTGTSSTQSSLNRMLLLAHMACGAVATMLVLPLGVLVPRYARGTTTAKWWFPIHSAMNGIIAFALIVAAFGIAVSSFQGGFNSAHRKCGLALFVLTICQVALGVFVKWYKSPIRTLQTKSGRGPANFVHLSLGLVVLILGWVTVWKAIDEEWARYNISGAPNVGWKVGWGLVVGLVSIAYIAGLIFFLPRQRKLERAAWERRSGLVEHVSQDSEAVAMKSEYPRPPPQPSDPPVTTRQVGDSGVKAGVGNRAEQSGST